MEPPFALCARVLRNASRQRMPPPRTKATPAKMTTMPPSNPTRDRLAVQQPANQDRYQRIDISVRPGQGRRYLSQKPVIGDETDQRTEHEKWKNAYPPGGESLPVEHLTLSHQQANHQEAAARPPASGRQLRSSEYPRTRRWRRMHDPIDQVIADPRTSSGPASWKDLPLVPAAGPEVTGRRPYRRASPSQPRTLRRSPHGQSISHKAIHNGVLATRTDATLEATNCSPTVMSPLPPTKNRYRPAPSKGNHATPFARVAGEWQGKPAESGPPRRSAHRRTEPVERPQLPS